MEQMEFKNDHDILITLVAEVRQARTEIKELKDGTADKISSLERRVEALEGWKSWAIGVGLVSAAIVGTMSTLLINHILAP